MRNKLAFAVRCFSLMAWLCALFVVVPAHAQTRHIAATLIAETAVPKAGSTVTLAIRMAPEAGWHGYWKNPGDAGTEPQIVWTLPNGATAGPLTYPVPATLIVGGLMNYVYEREYALLAEVKVPAGLAADSKLPVRAKLDYLVCTKEICVPESADLATELTIGDGAPDPARTADFAQWRASIPRPLGEKVAFAVENGRFRLGIPLPASASVTDAYFFPLTNGPLNYAAPQVVTRDGDRIVVETALADGASPFDKVEGVLRLSEGQGVQFTATPGIVAPPNASGGLAAVLLALGGAILGGLILNVMPCVFPILSLKALSLAKAGGDERAARRDALGYTLGAVLACMALGGAILGLRAAGTSVGWAFQLQSPAVIVVLLVLVSAIAANLAGLFELPVLGGNLAATNSVATGALAAFVATPCTGPFMGVALGAALVLPPLAALAVFAGLGFGLAMPFLLLGFVPAMRRRLPKPGPWMATLRRWLSIPMVLTAVALIWLLWRLAGWAAVGLGLFAVVLFLIGFGAAGRRQHTGKPARLGRAAAWSIATTVLLAVGVGTLPPVVAGTPSVLGAQPFDEGKLTALTRAGKPVFVYFTADWCVTCKVNEKAAIERGDVADAFAKKGITVMAGDWTRGDAAITRFLAAHDRSGVPLYLYYPGGSAAPQVLPQVLTPGLLTALGG